MRARLPLSVLLLVVFVLFAFVPSPSRDAFSDQQPSASQLLRTALGHELKAQVADHTHWKYQLTSQVAGHKRTSEVVESKYGDVNCLLSIDDHPLSPAERSQEEWRISRLIESPQDERKRQQDQERDAQKAEDLLQVLPNAVKASYGEHREELTEMVFGPNPDFRPATHEQQVFHAMEGNIRVNTKENRLVEINGHLIQSVKFAGGLLGHLDRGGHFQVKQADVAPGHWDLTLLNLDTKGKALFFKTIAVHQDESRSAFQHIRDDLTLSQAGEELRPPIRATEIR